MCLLQHRRGKGKSVPNLRKRNMPLSFSTSTLTRKGTVSFFPSGMSLVAPADGGGDVKPLQGGEHRGEPDDEDLQSDFVFLYAREEESPTRSLLIPTYGGDVLDRFFNALENFQSPLKDCQAEGSPVHGRGRPTAWRSGMILNYKFLLFRNRCFLFLG